MPAVEQIPCEQSGVERGQRLEPLAAPVEPILGVDARLGQTALAQGESVALGTSACQTGEGLQRQVEQDPIMLHHHAAQGTDGARHEIVVPLVSDLVEDLVEVARSELVQGLRSFALPRLVGAARIHEELDVAVLPQVRQQVARIVSDP